MYKSTILVAEDDVNLLIGIRDILQLEGYIVLTAANGEEALEVLDQSSELPDLIISDIMMPRLDGIELLKRVRAEDRFVTVPFIFLTARGERVDIQEGKALGVDDYIVKPFNTEDLMVAIRSRLQRAHDMKRVNEGREDEMKQNILTILNHEFRTPLTFIVAYSDLLNDLSQDVDDTTDMLTFLEGVQSGADRLRRLVENFITLVELQTQTALKNIQHKKRVIDDLPELIYTASEQAISMLPDRYHYHIYVNDDLPSFEADPHYLTVAIAQLMENACKFSSPDELIEISAEPDGESVRIAVSDNGRGIPEDELDNIWQIFYQIDRAHYEDQGSGSGLAIVKAITELHGGYVEVASVLGESSTFSMYFPVKKSVPAVIS